MVAINISEAEQAILHILPQAKALENNAINTKGLFLVFHSLEMDNAYLGQVGYQFRLYIAINTRSQNNRLAYAPVSEALTALIKDWQQNQTVEMGRIKPNADKGLLIYEIYLSYHPPCNDQTHGA